MELIEKINFAIKEHYKSNNGLWYVTNHKPNFVILNRAKYGRTSIKAFWVATFILRNFSDVEFVYCPMACTTYTRTTLMRAGIKF